MRYATTLIALSLAAAVPAAADDVTLGLRLPLTIDADQTVFDGIAGTVVYTGVRFSQGNISIEADEGRATFRDQQDGEWSFAGNVVIEVDQGRIACETADLVFKQSVLTTATVTGAPATFEMRRAGNDDVTRASAGRLHYDVAGGQIEFSEQATITEAGNVISSHSLLYNIVERKINADSSGSGEDRVRITYTPGDEARPEVDALDEVLGTEDRALPEREEDPAPQ